MARKTASRLDLRRMAEAAEARDGGAAEAKAKAPAKKKAKAAAKKPAAKRTKEKTVPRRMLMWAVYNGNMKEEARFPYADRQAAEDKLLALREKSTKKLFFIQPVKVPLGDAAVQAAVEEEELDTDDEPVAAKKKSGDDEEE